MNTDDGISGRNVHEQNDLLRKRVKELEAERGVADKLEGTFWDALNLLNLPAIRVENPGSHFVDVIRELQQLRAERDELRRVAKLTLDWLTPNPETPIKPSCMASGRLVIDVLSAALASEPQESDATPGSPALHD